MANHLQLRSGNPALSSETFKGLHSLSSENTMTINGTVNKTAISLSILLIAASMTYSPNYSFLVWPGFIGGFIVALITIFKKH